MDDLFGKRPKNPRRIMMKYTDVGQAPGLMPGWNTCKGAYFVCPRCGHDDGWTFNLTDSEVRRGMPCPKCNLEQGGA